MSTTAPAFQCAICGLPESHHASSTGQLNWVNTHDYKPDTSHIWQRLTLAEPGSLVLQEDFSSDPQGPPFGEPCSDCGGRGWEIFNDDTEEFPLGQVQACDCGLLEDDEQAYERAVAAGYVVGSFGYVHRRPS